MTTAAEYANGLRQLAEWIEAHPDIALPSSDISCYSLDEKHEAAAVLKALAPCKKLYGESLFSITRDFGPLSLQFHFNRKSVCTPRVVGTKVVPATPERIIQATPEHVVEIIEWDCEPILASQPETETA